MESGDKSTLLELLRIGKERPSPSRGTVQDIINGRHGLYVVTTVDGLDSSVTFALDLSTWKEEKNPRPGDHVYLGHIYEKKAGWRATYARFWTSEDEARETMLELPWTWSGYLTIENASAVRDLLIMHLSGRSITWVTQNLFYAGPKAIDGLIGWIKESRTCPEPRLHVHTSQMLCLEKGYGGGPSAINVYQHDSWVHIGVRLTDYSTGFTTRLREGEVPEEHERQDLVHLTFEPSEVTVRHCAPAGHPLVWVYAVERK